MCGIYQPHANDIILRSFVRTFMFYRCCTNGFVSLSSILRLIPPNNIPKFIRLPDQKETTRGGAGGEWSLLCITPQQAILASGHLLLQHPPKYMRMRGVAASHPWLVKFRCVFRDNKSPRIYFGHGWLAAPAAKFGHTRGVVPMNTKNLRWHCG
jgi:hypothetical protein